MSTITIDKRYKQFLVLVKEQIRSSQAKAALAVNSSLIQLYLFSIRLFYQFYSSAPVQQLVGLKLRVNEDIPPAQQVVGLSAAPVQQAAAPGQLIPTMPPSLALIPWGHHILILTKTKDPDAALFYMQQTIEHNWSRAILGIQIEQNLLKTNDYQPTTGIIFYKTKEGTEIEYALRGINKPIGVSEFTFTEILPDDLKSSIPTVEEFENELNRLS